MVPPVVMSVTWRMRAASIRRAPAALRPVAGLRPAFATGSGGAAEGHARFSRAAGQERLLAAGRADRMLPAVAYKCARRKPFRDASQSRRRERLHEWPSASPLRARSERRRALSEQIQ